MMSGRGGRLVVGVAALCYAAFALFSGLDRLSTGAAAQTKVPAFFASQALKGEVIAALKAGQTERAIAAGLKSVIAAPIEASSSSLLGTAYLRAYRSADAERAFKVSGQLGWRDVPTQVYWILAGLALSENELAADRLDALMRAAPSIQESAEVLVQLEASPGGRQALAARLAQGPGWLGQYAAGSNLLNQPAFAQRIALLRQALTKGKSPTCLEVSDAVNQLAYQQNRFAESRQLWDVACMQGRAGLLADPDFLAATRDPPTPFDWGLPGVGGVSARIGDGMLYASNDNPVPMPVARQYLMLPPGPVRIEWRAEADGDLAGVANAVKLLCPNHTDPAFGRAGSAQGSGTFATVVNVPANCSPQELTISIAREAGEVRVDAINLQPAASGN